MKDIHARTFRFACDIVRLTESLRRTRGACRPLATQILSAGTSIGANLEEAEAANSRADFIAKCRIALKEAREASYWLRIINDCESLPATPRLVNESHELVSILTAIVKNAQSPRP